MKKTRHRTKFANSPFWSYVKPAKIGPNQKKPGLGPNTAHLRIGPNVHKSRIWSQKCHLSVGPNPPKMQIGPNILSLAVPTHQKSHFGPIFYLISAFKMRVLAPVSSIQKTAAISDSRLVFLLRQTITVFNQKSSTAPVLEPFTT